MKELFISYSHKDEELRNELNIHLSSLKRLGQVSVWYDRRILGGSEFSKEIDTHIDSADIILLLVSPDFIASDYCYDIEVDRALERHNKGDAVVLPIILRPCNWHDLPFGKLMATPTDGKPILKFSSLDDGFLEVINELKRIIGNDSSADLVPKVSDNNVKVVTSMRSSNLSIKKSYSDEERDTFESESFEYIYRYFENSLNEISSRNNSLTYKCNRIDLKSFECIIYQDGTEKSSCIITYGAKSYFSSGITFSYGRAGNGINESLSIENDGYTQFLSPSLGGGFGFSPDKKLTMDGASEHLWNIFIRQLQ